MSCFDGLFFFFFFFFLPFSQDRIDGVDHMADVALNDVCNG